MKRYKTLDFAIVFITGFNTPEHLEGAEAFAIVMRDHYFSAIRTLECHVCEAAQCVGSNMVRARHDKLAELAQLVVVGAIGHIARGLVDSDDAQAVGAASGVRAFIGIERNIPEFDAWRCSAPIASADRSWRWELRTCQLSTRFHRLPKPGKNREPSSSTWGCQSNNATRFPAISLRVVASPSKV